MGHGYFTIVAYGIVVSVDQLLHLFPHLRRAQPYNETFDDDQLSMFQVENNIVIRYDEQTNQPETALICAQNHYEEDARCGGHSTIDLDFLQQTAQLKEFVDVYFSDEQIELQMFAYQGA